MKVLSFIAIAAAILALVIGAVVYPIMKKFCKNTQATSIVGWIGVGCAFVMFILGVIIVCMEAFGA